MSEPYRAAVHVVPADTTPDQEQAGPIVIEVIIRVQPDGGAHGAGAAPAPQPAPATAEVDALTRREQDVLQLLALGFRNREIAERLVLAESTIKTYVKHIRAKLGVDSRIAAAHHPQALRLVHLGDWHD